ncbi:MAG: hypothetical protein M3235_20050 [Actinomycetota bacterium]|nr:hypothetical protein [Actinomycetota bacterium]
MRGRVDERAASVIAAALLMVLLAGCGSGQQSQTANQVTATNGAGGAVGTIVVRDAQIGADRQPVAGDALYRTGQDVPIQVTIINDATMRAPDALAPDRLVAVSSPIARTGQIVGDAQIPDGQVLVAGYQRPAAATTVAGTRQVGIVLRGLTTPVRAGMTYPVTFTFARAGSLRLEVPVENPQFTKPRAETPLPAEAPPGVGTYPGTPAAPR